MSDNPDWATADPEMVRFIHEQAEIYLQAQFQSALASDSRATTLASIVASVSAAVFAGCIALWDKLDTAALWGGMVTASILLVAAIAGAWAARPIDFYMPGTRPKKWYGFVAANRIEMLGYAAEDYQDDILANEEAMVWNQRAIKFGFFLILTAPIAGLIAWACA